MCGRLAKLLIHFSLTHLQIYHPFYHILTDGKEEGLIKWRDLDEEESLSDVDVL